MLFFFFIIIIFLWRYRFGFQSVPDNRGKSKYSKYHYNVRILLITSCKLQRKYYYNNELSSGSVRKLFFFILLRFIQFTTEGWRTQNVQWKYEWNTSESIVNYLLFQQGIRRYWSIVFMAFGSLVKKKKKKKGGLKVSCKPIELEKISSELQ